MAQHFPYMSWRTLGAYYLAFLVICALGTIFAYQGPVTSNSWRCWAGEGAWKRDILRVIVGASLSLFVMYQMKIVGQKKFDLRDLRRLFPEGPKEWIFFLVLIVVFACLFRQFGTSFERDLSTRKGCKFATLLANANPFGQIWRPYIPYVFYMLGLWIGILWPILHCLLRWIRRDLKWNGKVRRSLERNVPQPGTRIEAKIAEVLFDRLVIVFQGYVIGLKNIADRYVSILVAVIASLAYEQITSSYLTATVPASEAGKAVLWMLLGPALLAFTSLVAFGYQGAAERVELGMKTIAKSLLRAGGQSALLERVVSARNELVWDRTPAAFVFGVAKSATVAMPLVVATSGYIATMLAGGNWLDIFLPRYLIQFVKSLYE